MDVNVVSCGRASASERTIDGVWGRSLRVLSETAPEAPELEAGAQKK